MFKKDGTVTSVANLVLSPPDLVLFFMSFGGKIFDLVGWFFFSWVFFFLNIYVTKSQKFDFFLSISRL